MELKVGDEVLVKCRANSVYPALGEFGVKEIFFKQSQIVKVLSDKPREWCECETPCGCPLCICANCHKEIQVINLYHKPPDEPREEYGIYGCCHQSGGQEKCPIHGKPPEKVELPEKFTESFMQEGSYPFTYERLLAVKINEILYYLKVKESV